MMNYQLLQGDCIEVLKTLPAASVHCAVTSPLLDKVSVGVGFAVYPAMAVAAQGHEVGWIESQLWIAGPRMDVVSVEAAGCGLRCAATNAPVIISRVDLLNYFFAHAGSIEPLAFGRATVDVVRISLARSAKHAVAFTAQPPVFIFADGSHVTTRNGKLSEIVKDVRLCYSKLRRNIVRCALPFNIFTFQPHFRLIRRTCAFRFPSALTRRNAIPNQPLIDLLRVAAYKLGNLVGAQFFNDVLLSKPGFINRLLGPLPFSLALCRAELTNLLPTSPYFGPALLTC